MGSYSFGIGFITLVLPVRIVLTMSKYLFIFYMPERHSEGDLVLVSGPSTLYSFS